MDVATADEHMDIAEEHIDIECGCPRHQVAEREYDAQSSISNLSHSKSEQRSYPEGDNNHNNNGAEGIVLRPTFVSYWAQSQLCLIRLERQLQVI